MTGALGTIDAMQKSAELPSNVALKNAQAAYALQHAGILPQQMDVERQKNAIAMYQAQIHSRAVGVEEALTQAKKDLMASQTGENIAKVQQLERERDIINEQLSGVDKLYATIDPRGYVSGRMGLRSGAHSNQVEMAKFVAESMFPGDPQGPAKALEWIKRTDENAFVDKMMDNLIKSYQVNQDTMAQADAQLRQYYRATRGDRSPGGSGATLSQPTDFNYYKPRR